MVPLLLFDLNSPDTAARIGGAIVAFIALYPTLEKLYDRFIGKGVATKEASEAEFKTWVRAEVAKFVPSGEIEAKVKHLGEQIAKNEGGIKLLHDRSEEVFNSLATKVQRLEYGHQNLESIPSQVSDLKTSHAILSNEVKQVKESVDKVSTQMDKNHRETIEMMKSMAFTQGQISNR